MHHAIASMITVMSRYTWVLGSAWSWKHIPHHLTFSHFYPMQESDTLHHASGLHWSEPMRLPFEAMDSNCGNTWKSWGCRSEAKLLRKQLLRSRDARKRCCSEAMLLGCGCSEPMLLGTDVAWKRCCSEAVAQKCCCLEAMLLGSGNPGHEMLRKHSVYAGSGQGLIDIMGIIIQCA